MKIEVTVEDRFVHAVLGDFSQHRSDIVEVTQRHDLKVRHTVSIVMFKIK